MSTIASTISDVVIRDHRELNEAYEQILNAADDDTRVRWQNQFTWELARHSIGEELIVYPAMEKHLGAEGKQMADKDRGEHQPVKEQLKKFQNLKPQHPDFIPTLKNLMADLNQHIKEEETHDLPMLEKALDSDTSQGLAKSFGRTKIFVPTRSHPSAPTQPLFESVVGLLAAPIDHLGDLFRKFPDHSISPNPSSKSGMEK
jgi:hemerythrin-like domain-containing protein